LSDDNVKRVFAIDDSGSTLGISDYWQNVGEIISKFHRNDDFIIFWNNEAKIKSLGECLSAISHKEGDGGGTDPESIIPFLLKITKEPTHLFIITDGEICEGSIPRIESLLLSENVTFDKVTCIIHNRYPNLSVCVPFIRHSNCQVLSKNKESELKVEFVVTPEIQDVVENIDSIQNVTELVEKYEKLKNGLVIKCIGRASDQTLVTKLINLRQKLAIQANLGKSGKMLKKALVSNDIDAAFKAAAELTECYYKEKTEEFAKLDELINIANGSLNHVFNINSIKSTRAARAVDVVNIEAEELNDVTYDAKGKTTIMGCPAQEDGEVDPVVIVYQPKHSILTDFDKNTTNSIIDCPLNAYNNKKFMDLFTSLFGSCISLKSVRETAEMGGVLTDKDGKEALGIIPLGNDMTHVKAANWTLANAISEGKKLGNPDLWFALFWLLVQENDKFSEIRPYVTEQMKFRLDTRLTTASLSGEANLPLFNTNIGSAIWFTLFSPKIENIKENCIPFDSHTRHITELFKLLKITGYPIPYDPTKNMRFINMKNELDAICRRNPVRFTTIVNALTHKMIFIDKRKTKSENKIRKQNAGIIKLRSKKPKTQLEFLGKSIDKFPTYIPVDAEPNNEQFIELKKSLPKSCKDATREEIYTICMLCNRNVSARKVTIPEDFKVVESIPFTPEWSDFKYEPIVVSPSTMNVVGASAQKPNFGHLYIECAEKMKNFPTTECLILYAYQKLVQSGKHSCLMPNIIKICWQTVKEFNDKKGNMSFDVFSMKVNALRNAMKAHKFVKNGSEITFLVDEEKTDKVMKVTGVNDPKEIKIITFENGDIKLTGNVCFAAAEKLGNIHIDITEGSDINAFKAFIAINSLFALM